MPEDECLIEGEPMFCFETAVKLLYWSGFVYEDDEVTSQTDPKVEMLCSAIVIVLEAAELNRGTVSTYTLVSCPGLNAQAWGLVAELCREVLIELLLLLGVESLGLTSWV